MKKHLLTLVVSAGLLPALTQADIAVVDPSDVMFVSAQTTLTSLGTVTRGNSDQVEARSRDLSQLINGEARSVDTFANFDISSIAAGATINSATLTATYDSQLNSVNSGGSASVGAVATAWNTGGSNNPLFTYGWDYNTQTTSALNTQVLIADVKNTAATGQAVSGDFTATVQSWVNGTLDNNGLVFFMDGAGSQGAGFNSVKLTVDYTPIPEPATLGLVGMIGGAMFFVRRRFML